MRIFLRAFLRVWSSKNCDKTSSIIVEGFNAPITREFTIFKCGVFHDGPALLIWNFNVDVVHASLRLRMAAASMPWTTTSRDVRESIYIKTTPFATRRKSRTTGTAELKRQDVLLPSLCTDNVGAEDSAVAAIVRSDNQLAENSLSERGIRCGCHWLHTVAQWFTAGQARICLAVYVNKASP